MFFRSAWSLLLFVIWPSLLLAQSPPHQTDFPPEEFQSRWNIIFDRIGDHAVAIIQGAPKTNGFLVPRQSNEFYYLCGIETPHAYLILNGKERKATVVLPPRDARLESAEGKVISSSDAELVKQITGAAAVLSSKEMTEESMRNIAGGSGTILYTPFAPAEGNGQSRDELRSANTAITSDPWDGRPSREAHFQTLLKSRFPVAEIRNLNPILDELRSVKSPREIALIRRASQLAGRGLIEAMKSSRPGVFEYQLDAAAALRLPRRRRSPRRLSLDHRRRHGQHLEHALLPQHGRAQGRRPRLDGLRSGMRLLHQRRRTHVAGEREVQP